MNAQTNKTAFAAPAVATAHWSDQLPYRALVAVSEHPNGTILYQVAGSAHGPTGAFKALQNALKLHPAPCFYCKRVPAGGVTANIDHIEPINLGGTNHLTNLVVACHPCNQKKGGGTIEAFNPKAAREWLEALQCQIALRLERVK